jgi:hypothetical protein
MSFEAQKNLLILVKSSLSVFPFVSNDFGIIFKKLSPKYNVTKLFYFYSKILALLFRSFIHFELNFVHGVR